jgi:hypothetical protein
MLSVDEVLFSGQLNDVPEVDTLLLSAQLCWSRHLSQAEIKRSVAAVFYVIIQEFYFIILSILHLLKAYTVRKRRFLYSRK